MATFLGNEGVVTLGKMPVAEVKSFSVSQSIATTEDTAMGDQWKSHVVTQKSWQGTITCHWDPTDTAQIGMAIGEKVSLKLYPQGLTSGNYELSGEALITGLEMQQAHEGLVEATFNYQGSGELTIGKAI